LAFLLNTQSLYIIKTPLSDMKIFFGKIASKFDPRQFQEGYYDTDSESWFNGIDVGDYAFIISGPNIELWQAKRWTRNGRIRLDFEKKVTGIEGRTAKFIAFKYFKLFPTLLSATTKSLRNTAFVPILLEKPIAEKELTDPATYQNRDNFRRIVVHQNQGACDPEAEDLQLYFEGTELRIFPAPFMSGDTFKQFRDNRDKIGGGRKKKDKTLSAFLNVSSFPAVFDFDTVNLRDVYETFAVPYEKVEETDEEEETAVTPTILIKREVSLNRILYGPPGTGKTYHSINHALAILENKPLEDIGRENRADLLARFKDYCEVQGQIMFSTFHQSMSYEDFVEGIKPQEPTIEQPQVTYKVEPGIFKVISEKARQVKELKAQNASIFKGVRFYKMSLGGLNRSDIYEWCLENNCLALGWGNDVNFESYKLISDWENYRDKFMAENPDLVKDSRFHITAMYAFQNMRAGDIVVISKGNKIIDAIGRVEGEYYWGDNSPFGYFQFRKIEWLAKNINQNPELFFSKKITQQSIYQFYDIDVRKDAFVQYFTKKAADSKPKPHVLIIDEINRGNVSQIFGELITLLETDKRMGNKEALKVTLPYSKDLFSVPPNLYLIGTMNTADRSVESLDTALRRRFSFIEMPPEENLLTPSAMFWQLLKRYNKEDWDDPDYLEKEGQLMALLGADDWVEDNKVSYWEIFIESLTETEFTAEHFSGIHLNTLLLTINRRIEKLLDKDHRIGHSYFLNIGSMEELKDTFYRNIIPLLQEYFFGDYGKAGLVLGKGFVEMDDQKVDFADFAEYTDGAELEERHIFRIKKESALTIEAFKIALDILLKNRQ